MYTHPNLANRVVELLFPLFVSLCPHLKLANFAPTFFLSAHGETGLTSLSLIFSQRAIFCFLTKNCISRNHRFPLSITMTIVLSSSPSSLADTNPLIVNRTIQRPNAPHPPNKTRHPPHTAQFHKNSTSTRKTTRICESTQCSKDGKDVRKTVPAELLV